MGAPQVPGILARINAIHEKKNHDYAQAENPFSNFERAAIIASWFNDPVDKVFAVMIGIKLARMSELLNGKSPKNESLADTFLDENTYSVLWHAWFLEQVHRRGEDIPYDSSVLHAEIRKRYEATKE